MRSLFIRTFVPVAFYSSAKIFADGAVPGAYTRREEHEGQEDVSFFLAPLDIETENSSSPAADAAPSAQELLLHLPPTRTPLTRAPATLQLSKVISALNRIDRQKEVVAFHFRQELEDAPITFRINDPDNNSLISCKGTLRDLVAWLHGNAVSAAIGRLRKSHTFTFSPGASGASGSAARAAAAAAREDRSTSPPAEVPRFRPLSSADVRSRIYVSFRPVVPVSFRTVGGSPLLTSHPGELIGSVLFGAEQNRELEPSHARRAVDRAGKTATGQVLDDVLNNGDAFFQPLVLVGGREHVVQEQPLAPSILRDLHDGAIVTKLMFGSAVWDRELHYEQTPLARDLEGFFWKRLPAAEQATYGNDISVIRERGIAVVFGELASFGQGGDQVDYAMREMALAFAQAREDVAQVEEPQRLQRDQRQQPDPDQDDAAAVLEAGENAAAGALSAAAPAHAHQADAQDRPPRPEPVEMEQHWAAVPVIEEVNAARAGLDFLPLPEDFLAVGGAATASTAAGPADQGDANVYPDTPDFGAGFGNVPAGLQLPTYLAAPTDGDALILDEQEESPLRMARTASAAAEEDLRAHFATIVPPFPFSIVMPTSRDRPVAEELRHGDEDLPNTEDRRPAPPRRAARAYSRGPVTARGPLLGSRTATSTASSSTSAAASGTDIRPARRSLSRSVRGVTDLHRARGMSSRSHARFRDHLRQ